MEHQPQNENDPIKREDAKYQIAEVVYDDGDAFQTYTVLKNERDNDGNKTGNVAYEPNWKIVGEGVDPDTGDTVYKLSPVGDATMAKYLTPDQLRTIQEKAAKLSRIESGIAAAAEKFTQRQAELAQERAPEYEDESSRTKSGEEARQLIEEAHRRNQAPAIPNLEGMMNGRQEPVIPNLERIMKDEREPNLEADVDAERANREAMLAALAELTEGLSDSDKRALWYYAGARSSGEEMSQMSKMSLQAQGIASAYRQTANRYRSK